MPKQFKKRKTFTKKFQIIQKYQKKTLETKLLYFLDIKKNKNFFSYQINIRIVANNIFCTLIKPLSQHIVYKLSTGTIALKTSKKSLKYNIKTTLKTFFKHIILILLKNSLIIKLTSPKYLKKILLTQIKYFLKKQPKYLKKPHLIFIQSKKCFNGCRPPKKIRKKRHIIRNIK